MIHYKNQLGVELTDLHIHVGGAVAPHILWEIAHQHGMKMPAKTYWDFWQMVTASPETVHNLDEYVEIMHRWTEKIQSSPNAIQRCVYSIIAKEYRSSNVSHIELRFNPMKRNRGGEMDLDHIIQAAVHGLDQAMLDYGVKGGFLFCLAREFPFEHNEIIVRKAIRYFKWGVVGIDMAGPEKQAFDQDPDYKRYVKLFAEARQAGLGITLHTGETDTTGPEGVKQILRDIKPERLGHGIQAVKDPELMQELAKTKTVLELCPSSNIQTRVVKDWAHFKQIVDKLKEYGVLFTINTDGPYLLRTNMKKEIEFLLDNNILTKDELRKTFELARSKFCKKLI